MKNDLEEREPKLVTLDNKLYLQIIHEDDGNLVVENHLVIAGYESFTGWYWFATEEADRQCSIINDKEYPDDIIYFGFVQGYENELGYFSKAEIESMIPSLKVWKIKEHDLPYAGRR